MEIEITDKKDNAILDRIDVRFIAHHDGEKTPTRDQVKAAVAKAAGGKADVTVIDHLKSDYGIGASRGYAKIYTDVEKARYHERDYVLKRNGLFVEAKKEEAE